MQVVFDVAVAGFVLLAAVLGAWKGLGWQMAAIVSPVAGLGLGIPLSARLAGFFGPHAPLNRLAALLVLYVAISLLVHLGALAYRKCLERWGLALWDRHMGAVAGAVKGFAMSLILTVAALSLWSGVRADVRDTRAGRLMALVVAAIRPALPEDVRQILRPYLIHLDRPAGDPGESTAAQPRS